MRENKPPSKDPAYWIFDRDPDAHHLYEVDAAHFRAKAGTLNHPVVSNGSAYDMERIAGEMIATRGSIIDIVDHYMDGARIKFQFKATAVNVYKRIVTFLQAHLEAMRTDITYSPPPVELFQQLGEFATSIRPWALDVDATLDGVKPHEGFGGFNTRPTFSVPEHVVKAAEPVVPKSVKAVDQITKYLEVLGGR